MAFIDEGLKVNSQVLLNMLQKKVLLLLTDFFENKQIFIHDDTSTRAVGLEPLDVSEAELDRSRRVSGQANVDSLKP